MKHPLITLSILFLFSCGQKAEKRDEISQLTFSMDTVLVDSKGEFLFLNFGLSTACLSQDDKTLYNLNIQEPSLETIDLDELALIGKQELDREGPNGIGNKGRAGIVHLGGDSLLFKGWPSPEIFNIKGEKLKALQNLYAVKSEITEKGKAFLYEAVIPGKPHQVYGIINENSVKNFEFGKINLLDNTLTAYALPTWKKLEAFVITYDDGQTADTWGPYIYVNHINQQVIVSSNISSEWYVYHPDSDSLHHYSYSFNLTNSEKTGTYPTEISNPREFHDIFKGIFGDVDFLPPIWDHALELYYRIHHKILFEDDLSGMYPKRIGAKVYLTVYDKDFQLKAEGELPQFQDSPRFHFAKDGKIWLFQNMNDEMGFLRLSFNP